MKVVRFLGYAVAQQDTDPDIQERVRAAQAEITESSRRAQDAIIAEALRRAASHRGPLR